MQAVKACSVLLWALGLPLVNDMTHLWDTRAYRRWWRPADRSQHSSLAFAVDSPVQMSVPHIHMGINHGFVSLPYSCCRELHPVVTLVYPALSQRYTVSTQAATRQGADLWFHGCIYHCMLKIQNVNTLFLQNVIKQCVHCYFTRDPVLAIRCLDVHVECMLKAGKFFRKFSGNYFCLKFKIFVFSLGLIHSSALDKGVCLIKYNNLNGSVIRSPNNQIDHCIYCHPIVIGSS